MSTLSINIGNSACNFNCRFCISKTTYLYASEIETKIVPPIALEKACRFATREGINTAIITGKGEPTLYATKYSNEFLTILSILNKYFPVIELQTNGSLITPAWLNLWKAHGLTTIAVSCVGITEIRRDQIMRPAKKDIDSVAEVSQQIRNAGLLSRLTCIVTDLNFTQDIEIKCFLDYAKNQAYAHQVIFRELNKNYKSSETEISKETVKWIDEHKVDYVTSKEMKNHGVNKVKIDFVVSNLLESPLIGTTPFGNPIFDYNGLGVVISDCVQMDFKKNPVRSYILGSNGHLYYSWDRKSAIIF